MNLAKKVLHHGLLVLAVILPFNVFAIVWANHLVGHLYIWSAVVYLIVVILTICSLVLISKNNQLITALYRPTYNKLAISFILLATIYLFAQRFAMTAIVGYALNTGFIYIFLVSQVAGYHQPKIIDRLVKIVLIVGLILSVVAILQIFVLPHDVLIYFGYDKPGVNTSGVPPASHVVAAGSELYRAQATMRGPNVFGAFLLLPIFIACYEYIKSRNKKYLAVTGVMSFALVLTYARSALIGIAVALVVFVLFDKRTQQKLHKLLIKKKRLVTSLGLLAVLVAIITIPLVWSSHSFQTLVLHHNKNVAQVQSTEAHGQLSLKALRQVIEEPLGLGLGQAGPSSALESPEKANIAEDNYLQIGQELGWIGLFLFVGLIISIIKQLWIGRRRPYVSPILLAFIAVAVTNLMLHIWTDEVVSMTLWASTGVVLVQPLTKNTKKV